MHKSFLIASFAVLTASVFGMNPDCHGESSGGNGRRQPFREIRPAPIPYNDLLNKYALLLQENKEKNGVITILNQQIYGLLFSVQIEQKKNERLESLFQEKVDEIEDWKDKYKKGRLATEINAEKLEERDEQIKKIQVENEKLKSLSEEKGKQIKELTEKFEQSQTKRRKLTEENEKKDEEIVNLKKQLEQVNKELKKTKELNQQMSQAKAKIFADEYKFTHIRSISSHNKTDSNKALYRQSHYAASKNGASKGVETPTTILVRANGKPEKFESILEIRYANNISHKKLDNPKAIFYRSNKDECYIVLEIDNEDYSVVYGLKERFIEIGKNHFLVYNVSKDMKSFTDDVSRLVYVDHSGLYIVPEKENSIDQVTNIYKENGRFNFKGSTIEVSAINGNRTLNNEKITRDNSFDYWVKQGSKIIVSKKQPNHKEIFVNFYPPAGTYREIYDSIGPFQKNNVNWLSSFVSIRINEELVKNGSFRRMLMTYLHNEGSKHESFCEDLENQVKAKGRSIARDSNILNIIKENKDLFKDIDFVRELKLIFDYEEKNCASDKKEEFQKMFAIVKNLSK